MRVKIFFLCLFFFISESTFGNGFLKTQHRFKVKASLNEVVCTHLFYTGTYFRWLDFIDGRYINGEFVVSFSEYQWGGRTYIDCDGNVGSTIEYTYIYCPDGPDLPCLARDSGWSPSQF